MSVNPNETVVPGSSMQPILPTPQQPSPEPLPSEPDYSGIALHKKYGGNWEQANAGYFNAVSELKKQHEATQALAQRNAMLEAVAAAALGGKNGPVNQDPLAELEALGIPTAPIASTIEQKARAVVEDYLRGAFEPIMNQFSAEETLQNEIQDFDTLKKEARAFMKENEGVAKTFDAVKKADAVEAWKYAIREMLITKQSQPQNPGPPLGGGLPGSATTTGRGAPNDTAQTREAREAAALQYGRNYGDMSHYEAARFEGTSVDRAVRNVLRQVGYQIPGEDQDRGW